MADSKYAFLKPEQKDATRFTLTHIRCLIKMPAGVGKTLVATSTIDILKQKTEFRKALVIAGPKPLEAYKKKQNLLGLRVCLVTTPDDLHLLSWNHCDIYALSSTLLNEHKRKILPTIAGFDLMVVDELHDYRNYKAKKSSALLEVCREYGVAKRFIGMTATPDYKNVEDRFAAMQYIDPRVWPSYQCFFDHYVIWKPATSRVNTKNFSKSGIKKSGGMIQFKEKLGYKNLDEMDQKMAPYLFESKSTKFTFHFDIQHYTLPPEAGQAYNDLIEGVGLDKVYKVNINFGFTSIWDKRLKTEAYLLPSGEYVSPSELSVGSYVMMEDKKGMIAQKTVSDAIGDYVVRLNAVQQYISQQDIKVQKVTDIILYHRNKGEGTIVYFSYLESLESVRKEVMRTTGVSPVVITGKTSDIGREMKKIKPDSVVLMSRVASQSLDFYIPYLVIYEENVLVPGSMEQLVGRITRANAEYTDVYVTMLVGDGTIEEYFHERLVYFINTITGSTLYNLLPHIEKYKGINFGNRKVSFKKLKELFLWKRL